MPEGLVYVHPPLLCAVLAWGRPARLQLPQGRVGDAQRACAWDSAAPLVGAGGSLQLCRMLSPGSSTTGARTPGWPIAPHAGVGHPRCWEQVPFSVSDVAVAPPLACKPTNQIMHDSGTTLGGATSREAYVAESSLVKLSKH